MRDDDEVRETPPSVVGAVAAGTAPLPFLAIYAVMFIVHGGFHRVVPPDITNSARGELFAGIIALALFIVLIVVLLWMLNGRRRWPFVLVQLAVLVTAVAFVLDNTKGGRTVSVIVGVAALIALCFAAAPDSWTHVGRSRPSRRKASLPAGSAPGPDATPTSARSVGRRRPGTKDRSAV
ncbi:MAG: hypothetical protein ABR571_03965 [Jatrophihabitans sp.]|uniref:hypothetical protein n=1 Tax=Jatrophihabitans sp. TaxID=1932789 RepID=UPI0039142F5E